MERGVRRRALSNYLYFFLFFLIILGGLPYSPAGQSAGLAVASALVTLGNPRRPSIDLNNAKESNTKSSGGKRKMQSQHPDNL